MQSDINSIHIGSYVIEVGYQSHPRRNNNKYKEGWFVKVNSPKGTIEERGIESLTKAIDRGKELLRSAIAEKLEYIDSEMQRLSSEKIVLMETLKEI